MNLHDRLEKLELRVMALKTRERTVSAWLVLWSIICPVAWLLQGLMGTESTWWPAAMLSVGGAVLIWWVCLLDHMLVKSEVQRRRVKRALELEEF